MKAKLFMAQVEHAWRTHAQTEDGRRLTRLHVHIAAKLAWWRSAQCRQRALAKAAGCSVRTVRRALHILNALSLLGWTKIVLHGVGWRVRVCNAYHLAAKEILSIRIFSPALLSPTVDTALLEKARRRFLASQKPVFGQTKLTV